MLHAFLRPGAWFAAKRYGYGAGFPIAWQGWVLLTSFITLLAGAGFMADSAKGDIRIMAAVLILVATGIFLIIAHRRTEGGWRWRWGNDGG